MLLSVTSCEGSEGGLTEPFALFLRVTEGNDRLEAPTEAWFPQFDIGVNYT